MSLLTDEITKRFNALKQTLIEFQQIVGSIDTRFDSRENEILNLEAKIVGLKEDIKTNQYKASEILNTASEDAAKVRNEAKQLMEQGNDIIAKARNDTKQAQEVMAEAQGLYKAAIEKQKEADNLYRFNEERKKKLMEAVK